MLVFSSDAHVIQRKYFIKGEGILITAYHDLSGFVSAGTWPPLELASRSACLADVLALFSSAALGLADA